MRSYHNNILNPVRNIIPGTLVHACIIIIIMLLLITTSFICTASGEVDIYVNQTGWWHSGSEFNASGTPIQAAVNSATAGSMIYVYNGTYNENVDVNKRLTLQGEGASVVNVTSDSPYDNVFEVTADYVNISGFSLNGVKYSPKAGIYLDSADQCNIFKNNISNNLKGIYLSHSSYTTLTNNTFIGNGLYFYHSYGNTVKNNTINDKPLLYYEDTSDIVIQDKEVGEIVLVKCSNFTIEDLNLSYASIGIELWQTNNCRILNNNASFNEYGIYLFNSSNNMLINNTAKPNSKSGIYLHSSSDNILTKNTVKSNDQHGIYLEYSGNNILINNTANSNLRSGILLVLSSNNMLTNNTANLNNNGISLRNLGSNTLMNNTAESNKYSGINIDFSNDNTLTNNTANSNKEGISLAYSRNNKLTNNTVKSNNYGIILDHLSNSIFTNNTFFKNGLHVYNSYGNTLKNNTINNNSLVYYEDTSDIVIQDQDVGQIVLVNCSNITIEDLNLSYAGIGIELWETNDCKILNNNASFNQYGIYLYSSSNNMLTNNTVKSNDDGIYLYHSSNNNTLTNNTARSNHKYGIYLYYSSNNNTLTNNTAILNHMHGIYLCHSSNNNTLTNNTAELNNYSGIYLYYSSNNNTLMNNTVKSNNGSGIYLKFSSENIITNNIANLNHYNGICLGYSSNNMLTNNIAKSNNRRGINLHFSSNNTIYNNYFDNTNNAFDSGYNTWNTTPALGTNIIGGSYLGGNYWHDYTGIDTTGDGLGDTMLPYNSSGNIESGGDYHPLVQSVPSQDTTPPVITNIANSTPTTDSIIIIWDTDENSNSLVRYGTVQSNYTDTVLDTVMVSAHNITLSGLSANTTYYFVVNSTDASSNSAQSEELNFTTAAATTPSFTTVSIENVILAPGESTTVPIMVNNVENLGGCRINLTYNASVVHVTGVLQGDMDYLKYNIDNGTGWMTANALNNSCLNGDIVFANIELNAVGIKGEETLLDITVIQLIDTGYIPIDHTVIDGTFITAAATAPSFTTVSIENVILAPGESTTVPIMVNNVENLGGCRINLTYNASVVHVTGVLQGDMDYLKYNIDNGTGWMTANALNNSGLNDDTIFANIELNAVGIRGEETLLDITVIQLIDTGFDHIDHTVIDGTFIIEADAEAPAVTGASASPDTILNDNGRPRAPGTNTTTLNVTVTDIGSGIANVTIDLSSIGGSTDEPMIREGETDVWTVTVNAVAGINLTHQLTVNATDNKGNFNDSVSITLTVLRRGDVCRNNVIDINDVTYIARYLADLEPECSNPPGVLVGDVVGLSGDAKGDGVVDLMDALYLARNIAGLEGEP